jgi:hypothetical protein
MTPSSSTPSESDLLQSVRKELILSQITVLELQDTILQKETDKADAISLLGQAELVLEGKINYIFELDRVLNAQIADLRQSLAGAETSHAALAAQLAAAQAAHAADREARDAIAQDLVKKLDEANRALGAAHELAGRYAREAAEARDKLAVLAPRPSS